MILAAAVLHCLYGTLVILPPFDAKLNARDCDTSKDAFKLEIDWNIFGDS